MSLLELMNACPNIAVVHIGEKTQVVKDTNRCNKPTPPNNHKDRWTAIDNNEVFDEHPF